MSRNKTPKENMDVQDVDQLDSVLGAAPDDDEVPAPIEVVEPSPSFLVKNNSQHKIVLTYVVDKQSFTATILAQGTAQLPDSPAVRNQLKSYPKLTF